jgi:hypothetical protein
MIMNEIISEKIMMRCIEYVKRRLMVSEGEGDMPLQEFMTWVNDEIKDCYIDEVGEGRWE